MKNLFLLATGALFAASALAAESPRLADLHMKAGAKCETCHVTKDTAKPVRKAACLACHGSYDALAKQTAAVKPNPHYNHYGDRDCSTCHKGHEKGSLMR